MRASGSPGRAGPGRLAPYLLILPLVVVLAQHPLGPERRVFSGLRETSDIGRAAYLFTQLTVIPRYLALAAWPAGQNLDPAPALHPAPDAAVLAGAALLAAISVAVWALRRRAPRLMLGWGWCLVTLAPESSLIPIRELMSEQRAYLPLAGLAWAAASVLALVPAPVVRGAATAAIVLALTLATHVRNRVWRDELTLWADATTRAPQGARAWNNLGLALEAAGRDDAAERSYRAALAADCYTRALVAAPGFRYAAGNLARMRRGLPPP